MEDILPTFESIWDKLNNDERALLNCCVKGLYNSTRRGKDIYLNTWNRMDRGSLDEKIWYKIPQKYRRLLDSY